MPAFFLVGMCHYIIEIFNWPFDFRGSYDALSHRRDFGHWNNIRTVNFTDELNVLCIVRC